MTQDIPFAHLSGPHLAFVEFSITQYQFPEMGPTGDWHDRNWLRVQFRVSDGDRQWSRNDPAWQTGDLPRLATWLRQTARGQAPTEPWTALEPLLTLVCKRASPTVELTAELRLELQSDDAKMSDLDWDNPETIVLAPTADELLDSAQVLDEAVRRLPPR
jgi:hypothetical protein